MTALPTRSGLIFNLARPAAESVNIAADISVALSLAKRFSGQAGAADIGYSVAQHCCLGADVLAAETGDAALAFHFLMHDAHEAYCGDLTTPLVSAVDAVAEEISFGKSKGLMRDAIRVLKARIDGAIFSSIGVTYPPSPEISAAVREMDRRMLHYECVRLLPTSGFRLDGGAPPPKPIEGLAPLICWTAADAAQSWRLRFLAWLDAAAVKS
ncbi:hypothetical protein SAMN02745157_1434 [Kaistia soli DSM 19436]|uniref:HD domain-containing protein n=1 Tax=Kaistia soli DSM 19436 TaxID=1122133 RepID=A0A1M4Y6E4_9HYPH|nr:hypothetical protein [Kaistia soli]SHF01143.1 hypothetical protein SAMN02745157_1434 [Kaistia soli DSM 19436]